MNILIYGIKGYMGNIIRELAEKDDYFNLVHGRDIDFREESSEKYDIIIDFSHPSSLEDIIKTARENSAAVLIGTTGYSNEELKKIEDLSKELAVLKATNMSLGMNLLFSLVEQAASVLKDKADIEVVESHHNRKKDAPSGSAKTIVESIEKGLGEERKHQFGREGQCKREEGEIGIHAIRGGNIVGKHEANFINELESIKISHEAYDRGVFADGAISAAKFLAKKEPGLYNMKDVLNL